MNNTENITWFDSIISSRQMQIIKSALPYIPFNEQKTISLIVKFTELKNTLKLFDGNSDETLSVCSDNEEDNLAEMLNSIKPYCTDEENEKLDVIYNIFTAYNLSKDNKKPDISTLLRSMLSPEQQSILESYSLLFDLNSAKS